MELFVLRGPEWDLLYNCSFYNVSQVPFEQRQQLAQGALFIGMGTVYELLYVVCMFALWEHRAESSCYKIMFYMGVLDMINLLIVGIGVGIFGILGVVYCSAPTINYLMGAISYGVWTTETVVEACLAFNRCVYMCSATWAERLFKGARAWLWMAAVTCYGLYHMVFWKCGFFSAEYFSWFYNPHAGYFDNMAPLYTNGFHSVHNWSVTVGLPAIYLFFGVVLFKETQSIGAGGVRVTAEGSLPSHGRVFAQVALISLVNVVTASIYCYMDTGNIGPALIFIGNFAWVQAHGIPAVIYLVMNRTLRVGALNVIRRWGEKLGVLKAGGNNNVHLLSNTVTTTSTNTKGKQQKQSLPVRNPLQNQEFAAVTGRVDQVIQQRNELSEPMRTRVVTVTRF